MNCGALATELTNEKCNFWHFRFDGHVVDEGRAARIKSLPADLNQGLSAEPGLSVRPVGPARRQDLPGQAPARRPGGRRRADPARQRSGFLALHHQDQGVGRAGADHRQLGPGHEPADQGRRRCRRRPALLHLLCASGRRADRDRCRRREPRVVGDGVQRQRARSIGKRSRGRPRRLPRQARVRFLRRSASAPSSTCSRRP